MRILYAGHDAGGDSPLAENPDPTEDEIRWALSGDLCRRARISVPAGLDIGGRTPGEIAVSVDAELIAVRWAAEPRVVMAAPVEKETHDSA